MLRATLLSASRSAPIRTLVENAPISRSVVKRFVPGVSVAEAVQVSAGDRGQRPAGQPGPAR